MSVFYEIKRRLWKIILPVFAVAVLFYLGYHTIQGSKGLIAKSNLQVELVKAQKTLDNLEKKKAFWGQRVGSMQTKSLDLDMLEMQAQKVLGYSYPDDIIVPVPINSNKGKIKHDANE